MDIAECSLAHLICIEGDSSVYTDSYVHCSRDGKREKQIGAIVEALNLRWRIKVLNSSY